MATTIQLPIDLRNPQVATLAGNCYWLPIALTAWEAGIWQFVKDVDGKLYGYIRIPKNMDATPNAKVVLVIAANATSGVSRLSVLHKAVQTIVTEENLNPASLTAITSQDITIPGTAYLSKQVSFTASESLAAQDFLIVCIYHEGAHANDTLAVNTLLFDAFLEIDVD